MSTAELKLSLFRDIDRLPEPQFLKLQGYVQRFLSFLETAEKHSPEAESIDGLLIGKMISQDPAFAFLWDEAEDIYTDADLLEKY